MMITPEEPSCPSPLVFAPCMVIPIYNHASTIRGVVESLSSVQLRCWIVDDGSDASTRNVLAELAADFPWVEILHRPVNGGKGAAAVDGFRRAAQDGFSHAVLIDADGQHCAADVPKFLAAARQLPQALIVGKPIFDQHIPKSRLYGRRISQFWVWVETLSRDIVDPLCGFRCYPLAEVISLLAKTRLGERMDFDIDVAVRLVWQGVPVVNISTPVRYFPQGISHFRLFWDNVRISWLHTCLCWGMLWRLLRGRTGRRSPRRKPK